MYPVLTLRRSYLVGAGACCKWLAVFDEICAMRGDDRAPLVRRGGVTTRDPQRLRVELTPLAQVWLARDGRDALSWLRARCAMSAANLRGANLRGADLRGANLRGANLRGAYLRGADRYTTDPPLAGWALRDGRLGRDEVAA